MAEMIGDLLGDLRKMPKEEKRKLRELWMKSGPNLHAPKADIFLRPAEPSDGQQIAEIWNHHVRNSVATPVVTPDTPGYWCERIRQDDVKVKVPFIVAILKHGKKAKCQHGEHIVGFGRAIEVGDYSNAFRYTLEIEMYVRDGCFHTGIGKTLFDRLMAALAGAPYRTKAGAPFIGTDYPEAFDNGHHPRRCRTILVSVLHEDNDPDFAWKKDFLVERNGFEQASHIPCIGYKFGKYVHMTQFHYQTYFHITPDLEAMPQL